jgi:hypothetical protein
MNQTVIEREPRRRPAAALASTRWWRRAAVVVFAYACWLAVIAGSALVIPLSRTLALQLSVTYRWGPWVLGAIDRVGIVVIAGAWVVWTIYAESVVRRAAGRDLRAVLRAVLRLALVAGALLLAFAGPIWLLTR